MPNNELVTAYQRARRDLSFFKDLLQDACDKTRNATIPLAQAWLAENYPDVRTKVTHPENIELTVAYELHVYIEDDVELGKAMITKIGDELEQYLKSLRGEESKE